MADTTMQIVIKAVDEASGTLTKIGGSLKSMEPIFKGMAVAGTAALGGIAAIGAKSVADFAEAEKASSMLEHAVIGVTGATQDQLAATSALADELERKGVLDGDNIKIGLAQLSTFGLSNKAVQGLGGALADLAVNQAGVSASGKDLESSANMIAKALNGQFGELQKSGIRFTEAQQKAIQFGTEMEKVDAINQGFAQNLKFTNEVALSTTEGQMAKASVAAGNLSESLGSVLAPMVKQLSDAIVPLLTKLTEWMQKNPELTKHIIMITAAIAGVLVVIGTLGLVIPAIISGFAALSAGAAALGVIIGAITLPMVLVVAGIAALIAAGVLLYKHWDEVKVKASSIWTAIKDFFIANWHTIISTMTFGLSDIVLLIVNNWDKITSAWASVWNGVKDILVSIMDGAKGVIMGTINWVIDKLNGAISLANSAIALANKVPGVNIGAIPTIPALATGGIVTSPTVALVGEAGPEAVIPLNGNHGGLGGTTLNLSIGNFWGGDPERAAREMGDLIIKRLQLNARVA